MKGTVVVEGVDACADPAAFYRLGELHLLRPDFDLTETMLTRNYRELNKTQRQAANVLLRNPQGISWAQALGHAEETSWRSLEKLGLAFFLPASERPERLAISLEHRFILSYRSPRNASLLEALADYRQEILQMMAAHWGLAAGPRWLMSSGIYAAARRAREKTIRALTNMEYQVLQEIVDEDSAGSTRADLTPSMRYTFFSFGRENFMRAPPAAERSLHSLILKGLVVFRDRREASDVDPTHATALYAVAGLGEILDKMEDEPGQAPEISTPPPEQPLSHADSLLRDIVRIWIAALSRPVKLTSSQQITKASLKKLSTLLRMDDVARLERLLIFSYAHKFMSVNRNVLSPRREIVETLAETAKNYADWALSWGKGVDYQRWGSLRYFFHGGRTEPSLIREEAARRLAALPAGGWASLSGLADAMLSDKKTAKKLQQNRYLGSSYQERMRALTYALREELRVLFDLGAVESDAALESVRPSPLLKHILSRLPLSVPPETVDAAMGLVVQPNLEVLAPLALPLADQYVLALTGALQNVEHMALYAFSLDTLYEGARQGVPSTVLRATLVRHSKAPLPRSFEALLQEFETRANDAVIMPASLLVRVRRPETGKLLEKMFSAKPLDGASGYYAMIAPTSGTIDALLAGLRRKGYFPAVDMTFAQVADDKNLEDMQ